MTRQYPERPIVGVGGVIVVDGKVVLIKRKCEPGAGTWSLPGGAIEVGETAHAALAREILEETGLTVDVGPVIDVVDRMAKDDEGRVAYHFVVIDYVCRVTGGVPVAGSDAIEVVSADPAGLAAFEVTEVVRRMVTRGLEMARQG